MTTPTVSPISHRRTLLCLGDSITQEGHDVGGWVGILQNAYRRKADVLNRGFGGYNSRMGVVLAEQLLPPTGPTHLVVTVFFGANDATSASKVEQTVPLPEYAANVKAIVRAALAVAACVVVITPPPVDAALWPDRGLEAASAYGAAAAAVAAEFASGGAPVGCVDAFALLMEGGEGEGWKRHLRDGLHLSGSGNAALAAAVLAEVARVSPGVAPDSLPLDFPIWRDVRNELGPGGVVASLTELAALHAAPFVWT